MCDAGTAVRLVDTLVYGGTKKLPGSSREIPDLPPADYRFLATILIDGHGRPRQLETEFRRVLERVLHSEFGNQAILTLLMRTDDDLQSSSASKRVLDDSQGSQEVTLHTDDPMVLTDHPDSGVVED